MPSPDTRSAVAGVGRAHGKLILCGEHAVVYGHPAIALAVDRHTEVTLVRRDGPTSVATPHDQRLLAAVHAVVGPTGFAVHIRSTVPVGRGMGSSAALSVALVRAHAAAAGRSPTPEEVHAAAFQAERVFHGAPSGVDHAVAARGGVVRYVKGDDGVVLAPLPTPPWRLVVVDSGTAGDTRALVAGVRARRPAVDGDLAAIGELVTRAEAALLTPAALGPLLTENHRRLARIGVSTPTLDRIVARCLDAGAFGAKLAGAGGGGVVIALVDRPEAVLDAARSAGWRAFEVGIAPAAG